jgi:hypothetical protein
VCALAIGVVLFNLIFVKMTSAIISAICTPFKDLSTIVFSDLIVDKRTETPSAVIGFAMACTASLAYNIHDVYEKRAEAAKRKTDEERKPLVGGKEDAAEKGKGPGGGGGGDAAGDEHKNAGERDDDWLIDDAYTVGAWMCVVGLLIYAYVVVWFLK